MASTPDEDLQPPAIKRENDGAVKVLTAASSERLKSTETRLLGLQGSRDCQSLRACIGTRRWGHGDVLVVVHWAFKKRGRSFYRPQHTGASALRTTKLSSAEGLTAQVVEGVTSRC